MQIPASDDVKYFYLKFTSHKLNCFINWYRNTSWRGRGFIVIRKHTTPVIIVTLTYADCGPTSNQHWVNVSCLLGGTLQIPSSLSRLEPFDIVWITTSNNTFWSFMVISKIVMSNFTAKCHFQAVEVVCRGSETQLELPENCTFFSNLEVLRSEGAGIG